MKNILTVFSFFFCVSCASSKDTNYTASTPADPLVRTFLGISLTDSIDFIRWNLTFSDNQYTLQCNYGIGKNNTNGFINGGEKLSLSGKFKKEHNNYLLINGRQALKLAILNTNLLHILNTDNSMLKGNGGWSYALNNMTPVANAQTAIVSPKVILKDSMSFEGRTPCGVPGIIAPGMECYKLKWYIVLYGDSQKNEPTTYKVFGTPWRVEGGRKGDWKIITKDVGKIFYQLNDEKGTPFINHLKLDDGVLIFTDAKENLLVGDLDFSYTLNRRF